MDLKEIGEAVQALRLAKGLNVREAGALPEMPVGFGMLNAIENGGNTSLKTLDGVVRALGGDLDVRIVPAQPNYLPPPEAPTFAAEGTGPATDLFRVVLRTVTLLPRLRADDLDVLLDVIYQLEQGANGQGH